MTLAELEQSVDSAIEKALENGENPSEIPVSIQIDGHDDGSVFTHHELRLHYDGGVQCTGCVLIGFLL